MGLAQQPNFTSLFQADGYRLQLNIVCGLKMVKLFGCCIPCGSELTS